jgi:hypothetical protein
MCPEAIVTRLAEVRSTLDLACERLTSPTPDALDACSEDFASAVEQLERWRPEPGVLSRNAAALEEAWRVRRSFLRALKLMQNAAAFHGNWMRLRGAISGGYTRSGEPKPVMFARRICVEA